MPEYLLRVQEFSENMNPFVLHLQRMLQRAAKWTKEKSAIASSTCRSRDIENQRLCRHKKSCCEVVRASTLQETTKKIEAPQQSLRKLTRDLVG
jgi:hypothetical protein